MGNYVNARVFIAKDELNKTISLFEYAQNNLDDKLKKVVKPVMSEARKIAAQEVRQRSWSNPKNTYSYKLKIKGTNNYKRQHGRYAKSLRVKDHSKPYDVFYEVTGNKKEYRLSHLIEHSHRIKINKKFIAKKTKPINHMYISQSYVDKEAPKECEKVIDKLFK